MPAAAPAKPAAQPAPAAVALTPEQRQAAEAFYQGKTVRIIVGSGAGGGFDTTGRIVSRHIGKHIPGNPTLIVENMPGGGLVAANHIYTAAPKDGLVIGIFHEAQTMSQVTGADGVQFDLRKFNWLGSSFVDPNVCIVRSNSPIQSFADLVNSRTPISVGGTGPGSNTYDAPRVVAAATGANLKAVAGYPSTNDVRIGIERGELNGMCLGWESVQSSSSQWLQDGYAKVLVQNGSEKLPDLPDVPLALEFAKDEENKALLLLVDAPGAMAKPFALPPEVDPVRVQALRAALTATYQDPAFLEEAKALKLEFQPKTPEQILRLLDEILATPPDIVAKYKQIIQS